MDEEGDEDGEAAEAQEGNGDVCGNLVGVHGRSPGVSWAMRKVRMTKGRM